MLCADTPIPIFFVFTDAVPQLLYYSHIPAILVSLLLGIFVFIKNKNSLASKALFFLAISFSLWATSNLFVWTNANSSVVLFFWSSILAWEFCIFLSSFYFCYVFIKEKDISFLGKIIIFILSLPVLAFLPTSFNLFNFDVSVNCGPLEGFIWNYLYVIEFFVVLFIIVFSVINIKKADAQKRKQLVFFSASLLLFLASFFVTGYISSLLYNLNITDSFELEQYGLFGMTIFIGVLVYLIVKFKAFNIKLIGAQALIIALIILVGSQFFFIQNDTNRILTGLTLILVGGFGIYLIRSIKAEVQRKEELQHMSDKLAEANDKLRKLDNAKSEFISIASHQLRTPLTAIKGFISLLNEGAYGNLDPKQAEVLKKVYISNERLIALVEDLLNISRIESGRMEFKFDSCQLTDLCGELVDTFTFKAKDANLYLDFKAPENVLPEAFIDRAKVREVLSNLIDNAIKYTPKGGVSVRLERVFPQGSKIENVSEKGSIKITIADTGIGVPAEEIPYLFSKFSRGKDVGRLNVGGTGLGLYVGRSMVEANGGKIWVESDGTDKGSRFIIEVPIEQTQENLTRWS